jgi:glycosyltransferase 2 family protein
VSNRAEPQQALAATPSHSAASAHGKWRRLRSAVRWVATIGLFTWLAISTDWHSVWATFKSAAIPWLAIAGGIYLASQFASVARWRLLIDAASIPHTRGRVVAAYFEGMFVNICLPTTVGGDVMKVLRVGGANQKRIAAATVVADRASGLAALVALLGLGLTLKLNSESRILALDVAVVSAIAAVTMALWVRFRLSAGNKFKFTRAGSPLLSIARRIDSLVPEMLRRLITNAPWLRIMLWAFLVQSLNVAAVWVAGLAIGIAVPLAGILVATTTVSLAAALPISIAGFGVREVSLPFLLAADGVPRELAVTLALAWSVIVFCVGLTGGPAHFAAQRRTEEVRKQIVPTRSGRAA